MTFDLAVSHPQGRMHRPIAARSTPLAAKSRCLETNHMRISMSRKGNPLGHRRLLAGCAIAIKVDTFYSAERSRLIRLDRAGNWG